MEDRAVSILYLYGFVPAGAPPPPPSLAGLGGAVPELVQLDAICAVIGRVPAAQYGGHELETRLQDLAWVGEQGLAHERVVLWFADHSDVLPVRLFSMYSSEEALRQALTGRVAAVAAQLRALAGRREWNLKIAFDADELGRHGAEVSPQLQALAAEIDGAPPGRRYLLQRKHDDVLAREIARAARRLAMELLESLRPYAADVRVLPLARAGPDDAGTVVLNAALLVSRDEETEWRREAERHMAAQRALGMLPNLTGPWAPYRFVESQLDV
jgi:hypothetical protein